MSGRDSVIDISSSPEPPAWRPPASQNLSGKSFHFGGIWATMSTDHARELCRANGGSIVAPSSKPTYVVVGARSPPSTFESAKKMGKQVLTELQYIALVLGESVSSSQSPAQAGQKRPAEAEAGPSKPSKARKSDPGPGLPPAPDFPRIGNFLYDGEIRLEKKMLMAYDCGGPVFKAMRGKNPVDLLQKFEDWLPDDLQYHHKIMSFPG
ncbi:uncharacterized protein C8Q71DRAFT_367662 [Rhodofomes roseus]|uniref:BRCT domain-containing protein n=1 Tax=Rhodofomes roseus TaxID=34475 RepID=A0ABQ8K1Y7_9APHY|nr:uncharacterized protein C8Q71DRAFT_367662 [Rhodofomes roseus]KAH9830476.1 hypothetical protein C8Q71DRAFT_367662 [Rhodofomes roseus]